ncbi:MAG: tRNA-dihydrouridine synthase family protein [Desulfobacterales bacterium]|nr:tRNA-dihydrouridine synthase family protein [Desulfobacterales bacterium]
MPPPKLYMAPLKGYTDRIFRNTFAEHFGGFDLAVAPFIVCTNGNKVRRKYFKDLLPENNSKMPVIPQILSRSAEGFTLLANHLFDLGYETVNWNLGCPASRVAKKMRGSGLLPHTDLITTFLEKAIPAIKGKLSIKTRLGRETNNDIFRLIPALNRYPIEEIIIHPRTGIQMYRGSPDLKTFEQCLSMTSHSVIYNGDIRSAEDFMILSERFNTVKGWMIGRWSLVNPFLPMIIKTGRDDIKGKSGRMKLFHDSLFEQYGIMQGGPSHILNRMKGFWRYFSMAFRRSESIMERVSKTRSPEQYLNVVNHIFETKEPYISQSELL